MFRNEVNLPIEMIPNPIPKLLPCKPEAISRATRYAGALRNLIDEIRKGRSKGSWVKVKDGVVATLDGKENGYKFRPRGDESGEDLFGVLQSQFLRILRKDSVLKDRLFLFLRPVLRLLLPFRRTWENTFRQQLQVDNTTMLEALAERFEAIENGQATFNRSLADAAFENHGQENQEKVCGSHCLTLSRFKCRTARCCCMCSRQLCFVYLGASPELGKHNL